MKLSGEKIESLYVDMRNFFFAIEPELQKWHNENIFPKVVSLGVKKIAIQLSPDIFAQVSTQQTIEEDKSGEFQSKYFDDQDEAFAWLTK